MTWAKSNRRNHRARSRTLSGNLAGQDGAAGLPAADDTDRGSKGGAPIWVMDQAFVPPGHWRNNREADPDGFAVFGRFPVGWLTHILRLRLLGSVRRTDILHVCSGTLSETEAWTVDLRSEAKPRIIADGRMLPFPDASFPAVLLDPPYSDQYARNLYGIENPRPSWLLREAARVVMPGGRVGILHIAVPFSPPACRIVKVYGVSTGVGFRIRAFTVYERWQKELLP